MGPITRTEFWPREHWKSQFRFRPRWRPAASVDCRSAEVGSGAGHCQRSRARYPGGMTSNDNRSSGLCVARIVWVATCV